MRHRRGLIFSLYIYCGSFCSSLDGHSSLFQLFFSSVSPLLEYSRLLQSYCSDSQIVLLCMFCFFSALQFQLVQSSIVFRILRVFTAPFRTLLAFWMLVYHVGWKTFLVCDARRLRVDIGGLLQYSFTT